MLNLPCPTTDSLARALQRLPPTAPQRSALPALLTHLRPAPPRSRAPFFYAAAACALLATLLGWVYTHKPLPPAVTPPTTTDNPIPELIADNQLYEAELRQIDHRVADQSAQSALSSAEVEDLIGMLDLQLSVDPHSSDAQALWRKRVQLMQELAALRARGAQARPHLAFL